MKRSFFPSSGRIDTTVWMHYMDANKTYREKAWLQLDKNAASNIEQVIDLDLISKFYVIGIFRWPSVKTQWNRYWSFMQL